ncbi:unnamed protein product [Lampetra planeri]
MPRQLSAEQTRAPPHASHPTSVDPVVLCRTNAAGAPITARWKQRQEESLVGAFVPCRETRCPQELQPLTPATRFDC